MERALRFSNTDPSITYTTGWKEIPNSGGDQNESYSLTTILGAQFFFLFRGTSVKFYGRLGGGRGSLVIRLDVNNTIVPLNGTNIDNGPTLLWSMDNLGDGDHQLFVTVRSLVLNASLAVDYFEVENTSGNGFDLQWAGPNATNVPKEAIIVDNSSPDVVFSNPAMWASVDDAQYYGRSVARTIQAGAGLSFSFDGVAIWYYSDMDTSHGFYTVSIDGSDPKQLDGRSDGGQLSQQMLWSKTDLAPGPHIFILRQDDFGGTYMTLDFFRVLRASNASALPPSTPTGQGTITPKSKPNVVPLAVGLTFGLLILAIAVLGAFYLRRRRRGKPALLDADATPLTPPAQGEQRSGAPRERKQPAQQPTHGSTLPSSAPTAMVVPTTPIGITESEMPPSYESHMVTARVVMAK